MPALARARLTEIRDLVADLVTHRAAPPDDVAPLLARCEKALVDVLGDRDDLVAELGTVAEELATWTGSLR
ncbi:MULTISPECIES: hypothetical protein [unclassified Streptomyces]|uniref:hypothetical protein n=1 Tax=unclassified Streptomyces TaxID=2593676 RepID=UPI00093D628D|nr:hypothetical protein [Streptomyces sp. TSRI0281]OKI34966.1 hypothetical protein A6A29_16200 [Streptomyces sp. TSRI0281]